MSNDTHERNKVIAAELRRIADDLEAARGFAKMDWVVDGSYVDTQPYPGILIRQCATEIEFEVKGQLRRVGAPLQIAGAPLKGVKQSRPENAR